MIDKKENINYSKADIDNYLLGKMQPAAMHQLERAALQDSFLADAIEGYNSCDKMSADKDLIDIEAMILGNKQQAKIVPINKNKNNWWKFVAACLVLITTGSLGIMLMNNKANEQVIAKIDDTKTSINKPNETLKDTTIATNNNSISKNEIRINKADKLFTQKIPSTTTTNENAIVAADTNYNQQLYTKNNIATNYNNKFSGPSVNNASSNNSNFLNPDNKDLAATPTTAPVAKDDVAAFVATDKEEKKVEKEYATNTNTIALPTIKMKRDSSYDAIPIRSFASNKKTASPIAKQLSKEDSLCVPVNGWAAFNEYIQQNNKPTLTYDTTFKQVTVTNAKTGVDVVALEFFIDKDGSPEKIKIVKSVDEETDLRAIELLKNGPKWQTQRKKQKGKVSIKF